VSLCFDLIGLLHVLKYFFCVLLEMIAYICLCSFFLLCLVRIVVLFFGLFRFVWHDGNFVVLVFDFELIDRESFESGQ